MSKKAERSVPDPIIQAFAPLHKSALGIAVGVVLGTIVFLSTLGAISPRPALREEMSLLRQFCPGYTVSQSGALVGLAWGFLVGFALGWTFALFRNLGLRAYLTAIRSRAEMDQYNDLLD